jgi:hypothetical protein
LVKFTVKGVVPEMDVAVKSPTGAAAVTEMVLWGVAGARRTGPVTVNTTG